MALLRILVDGYSLLHNWRELAPGQPRHAAAAREALVQLLARYQDATGTPVTVFFDGAGCGRGEPGPEVTGDVEVLYSPAGTTADQMIERVAHRLAQRGEVLVVTDDRAERETVSAVGALTCSCGNFIRMVEQALAALQQDITRHNRQQQARFGRPSRP